MTRFWLSWWEAPSGARPPRPTHVEGCWCTGIRMRDDAESWCAIVDAEHEGGARALVERTWAVLEWRFAEGRAPNWHPHADRFPQEAR